MSLRDLTAEKHKAAERQEFVKELLGGSITEERYATFLYNLHPIYNVLETFAMVNGLLADIPEIRRAPSIQADYTELWKSNVPPALCPTVSRYMKYIKDELANDPDKLMAHLYVRHMGDLAGGQMIAKRVPGSGTMYQFDNIDELKTKIRAKLKDSMGEEANVAFDFAIDMMKDMMEDEQSLGNTD
jgi:heme oxygenase (biliverdin-producing, ferredoxin)